MEKELLESLEKTQHEYIIFFFLFSPPAFEAGLCVSVLYTPSSPCAALSSAVIYRVLSSTSFSFSERLPVLSALSSLTLCSGNISGSDMLSLLSLPIFLEGPSTRQRFAPESDASARTGMS